MLAEVFDCLGIWTLNEIRRELWDKEEVEGGDIVQSQQPAQDPFSSFISGGFSSAESEEDEVELEDFEESEEESIEDKSADDLGENKYIDELQPQDKGYRESVVKAVIDKHSEHIAYATKSLFEVVKDPSKQAKDFWEKTLTKWGTEAAKVAKQELRKASARKKAIDDDEKPNKIPSKRRLRKMVERALENDSGPWLDTYIEGFNEVLDEAYDLQIQPMGLSEEDKVAVEALKDRTDGRRTILQARGMESFKNIKKNRTEQIMKLVEQGVRDRKSISQITDDITNKFKEISDSRASTIARTEAMTAISIGKVAAQEDAAEVVGKENLVKVWINLGDERVRGNPGGLYPDSKADHWTLQGETKDLDEPFSNGLDYPRDLNADSFGEVINCRCDMLTVAREDLESLKP